VLDAFSGAGGDSIQLALANKLVYSNDIDPQKLQLLINNAAVYAVDNIEVLNSDFLKLDLPNT
jgi:trimethylguanosine synthase